MCPYVAIRNTTKRSPIRGSIAPRGGKMVTVTLSETYDLSTKLGRMTLIGVHTPKKELIQKMYPGFAMQYKYFRINSVSIKMASVSTLPVSPDQVGADSSQIAPEDMLNPILYKAVSNNSWSTMEARLAGLGYQISNPSGNADPKIVGNMAFTEDDSVSNADNTSELPVYYSLLSGRQGFRVAHPQQGLAMRNLKPIVFEKWYTHGVNDAHGIVEKWDGTTSEYDQAEIPPREMLGRAHRMPKINTTYLTGIGADSEQRPTNWERNGMGNGAPFNYQCQMPDIEPVMLAMAILPPCVRTKMYYRMVVRCSISFFGKRPMTDITSFAGMSATVYPQVYHSDYAQQSKVMDATTDMVDVKNANITKIMEGC